MKKGAKDLRGKRPKGQMTGGARPRGKRPGGQMSYTHLGMLGLGLANGSHWRSQTHGVNLG